MRLSTSVASFVIGTLLVVLLFLASVAYSQADDQPTLTFIAKHRVNAHGDEFNSLAQTADGRLAIIGTEKGDLIVWNLASQKRERTLHQPSAVHLVTSLSDPRYLIAAGANHHSPTNPLARKWNLASGTFEDLPGLAADTFPLSLASDKKTGLVALGVSDETIIVWDSATNKVVANFKTSELPMSLAIIGRYVYVAGMSWESARSDGEPTENVIKRFSLDDPASGGSDFVKTPGRYWSALGSSPDQLLVASYSQPGKAGTIFIAPDSGSELTTIDASSFAWINFESVIEFEGFDPASVVQLGNGKKASVVRKLARMTSDTEGRAFDLTGQIANREGTKAWATYRKGPGFLEFDLKTQKIKTLLGANGGAYAISVAPKDSPHRVLATGGADGFVRIWKFSDFSMSREYRVASDDSFVANVELLPDAKRAVVSLMRQAKSMEDRYKEPLQLMVLDLNSGAQRKLFDVPAWQGRVTVIGDFVLYPFVDRMKLTAIDSGKLVREFVVKNPIRLSMISSNKKWLAVLDEENMLSVFDVSAPEPVSTRTVAADDLGFMAITNDGRYVHQVTHDGRLLTWNTQSGIMSKLDLKEIQGMHTNVDFITLANDDQWLVTAGNHGDVGIFERTTGKLICYDQSGAATFYAEKAWVEGDRLIFTTDTGVMFAGQLVKATR